VGSNSAIGPAFEPTEAAAGELPRPAPSGDFASTSEPTAPPAIGQDAIPALMSVLRRVARSGASLSLVGLYLGIVAQYGMHFLLARQMGAATYAYVAVALNVVSIGDMVVQLGFSHGIVKLIGAYSARGEQALLVGALRGVFLLTLAAGVSLGVLGATGAWLVGSPGSEWTLPMVLGFAAIPGVGLLLLVQNMARGFGRMGLATLPQGVLLPALTLALWYLYPSLSGSPLPAAPLFLGLYAAIALGLALLAYARVLTLPQVRAARGIKPLYEFREWLRMSLPMLASVTLYQLLQRGDLLILSLFAPAQQVGVYSVASRLAQAVAVSNMAFNRYWAAGMARRHALGDAEGLQRLATKTARVTFLVSLALCLGLALAGPSLVLLFGPDFGGAYSLMLVLLAGQITSAYFAPNVTLLQMGDRERVVTRIYLLVCLLVLAAYLGAVPWYGALATAIVTSAGLALLNLLATRAAMSRLGCYAGAF
jgi:O-antigen/teichoic acid export membrane protein